ncbi:50S ribosomal protein L9 [Acidobacteriota bacterium]
MKIILKDNIENLGKRGDIVNVAPGYGRNYLIPKKLAIRVTKSNEKMILLEQKALRKKLDKEISSFSAIIERVNQVSLTFSRKVGEHDLLFGSVSVADIKDQLDQAGFEIEKKKILLAEPIKKLGSYKIPIRIFHDDHAEIQVSVLEEGAEHKEIEVAIPEDKQETEPTEVSPVESVPEETPAPEMEEKTETEAPKEEDVPEAAPPVEEGQVEVVESVAEESDQKDESQKEEQAEEK